MMQNLFQIVSSSISNLYQTLSQLNKFYTVNMESSKDRSYKDHRSGTVNSRRHSLTTQFTRTARRFSATIAPNLIKLDPLPLLENYEMLNIRLADDEQVNYFFALCNTGFYKHAIPRFEIIKINYDFIILISITFLTIS